jgi:hypothetical protein
LICGFALQGRLCKGKHSPTLPLWTYLAASTLVAAAASSVAAAGDATCPSNKPQIAIGAMAALQAAHVASSTYGVTAGSSNDAVTVIDVNSVFSVIVTCIIITMVTELAPEASPEAPWKARYLQPLALNAQD